MIFSWLMKSLFIIMGSVLCHLADYTTQLTATFVLNNPDRPVVGVLWMVQAYQKTIFFF